MRHPLRAATLALAALTVTTSAASARCNVAARPFVMGQPGHIAMSVSGEPCRISLQAGGQSHYDSLSIVERPRGGRLVADGHTGVVYTPYPGFSGTDRFVFAVTGTSSIGSGTSELFVDVVVD
ncbi:MAG: Ig-like domain-containing protein [Phreatobacter sp.]|uniref:Ig-like domain-containing protein n=1 Tax=Phreatobacter sp. TaxID=1966341 RepID=UPI0027364156|nr:Ig-like domain-containing protein [Phreatobacter sp.]MDP2801153.1 Ig-like domain-containing protein [Phreatobacter sp.]